MGEREEFRYLDFPAKRNGKSSSLPLNLHRWFCFSINLLFNVECLTSPHCNKHNSLILGRFFFSSWQTFRKQTLAQIACILSRFYFYSICLEFVKKSPHCTNFRRLKEPKRKHAFISSGWCFRRSSQCHASFTFLSSNHLSALQTGREKQKEFHLQNECN